VRVFAVVGYAGRDIVDENEEIENGNHREEEHSEGDILEHVRPFSGESSPVFGSQCSRFRAGRQPVAAPPTRTPVVVHGLRTRISAAFAPWLNAAIQLPALLARNSSVQFKMT